MANTNTTTYSNLVTAAYDRLVEFALRSQPMFRAVADKRPAQQAMPGSSVVLERYVDMAQATGTLDEDTDPTAVALSNTTTVSITLNEYGNAVLRTRKLNLFSLSDVDPAIANIIAYNMADSVDEVVQTVLRGGTNYIQSTGLNSAVYNTGAITDIVATDTMNSAAIRLAVAKLRAGKAVPKKGNLFWSAIHPEVSHDLRAETGGSPWRDPHTYSAPGSIWAGEIGQYEGAFFVESPRCYTAVDGAGGTVRTFRTYMAGQQALAEAVAEDFHVIVGPVTDKLMRARPIGWYGVAGWARYREESLLRIETSSTIHSAA